MGSIVSVVRLHLFTNRTRFPTRRDDTGRGDASSLQTGHPLRTRGQPFNTRASRPASPRSRLPPTSQDPLGLLDPLHQTRAWVTPTSLLRPFRCRPGEPWKWHRAVHLSRSERWAIHQLNGLALGVCLRGPALPRTLPSERDREEDRATQRRTLATGQQWARHCGEPRWCLPPAGTSLRYLAPISFS